jgi:hypothetical protein
MPTAKHILRVSSVSSSAANCRMRQNLKREIEDIGREVYLHSDDLCIEEVQGSPIGMLAERPRSGPSVCQRGACASGVPGM